MSKSNKKKQKKETKSNNKIIIAAIAVIILVIAGGTAIYKSMDSVMVSDENRIDYITQRVVKVMAEDIGVVGSGFIISPNGLILTNIHLLSTLGFDNGRQVAIFSQKLKVLMPNGETLSPSVVAEKGFKLDNRSNAYDFVILRVDRQDLPYFTFGESRYIEENESVFFSGYMLDGETSLVGGGKVSDIFSIMNSGFRTPMAQINNINNGGFSGGPVLNKDNKVVGIMSLLDIATYTEIKAIEEKDEGTEITLQKSRKSIFGDMISKRVDIGYAIFTDPIVEYLREIGAVQ